MKQRPKPFNGKLISGRFYPGFFPLSPNDRAINLGCGEGPQAVIYAGHYGEMVGVDINRAKLKISEEALKSHGVRNYTTICASAEEVPLADSSFDKVIAIAVMPCIPNPKRMCLEANRLLKEQGELLITFPGPMYFRYIDLASRLGRYVSRRKDSEALPSAAWDSYAFYHRYSLDEWVAMVEDCGFRLQKSRASTLFPPLHLYGVPRFWFSSDAIHRIDSFLCNTPTLKAWGQDLTCVFLKEKSLPESPERGMQSPGRRP